MMQSNTIAISKKARVVPALFALLFLLSCSIFKHTHKTENGFVKIFDEKSLDGWEGDSTYWKVTNGILTGEVLPATILKQNSFIIWRKEQPDDFELKAVYRVSAGGNSGINYRSEEVQNTKYALKGYQADIDGGTQWSGQNYEERGRTFLALRGQKVILETGKPPQVISSLGSPDSLQALVKNEDWNEYHLVVKGNHLQHYLNGVLMSDVTDNDKTKQKFKGLIGVQVHVGPPMKIEYRNFRIKEL